MTSNSLNLLTSLHTSRVGNFPPTTLPEQTSHFGRVGLPMGPTFSGINPPFPFLGDFQNMLPGRYFDDAKLSQIIKKFCDTKELVIDQTLNKGKGINELFIVGLTPIRESWKKKSKNRELS